MTSTHPKSESALLLAMANAQTTDEQRQIAAELETVRSAKRTQDEADRMSSLSLAALAFPDSDTERHTSTASSDWLGDIEVPQVDRTEMENQMRAQATVWLQGRPAEVRADGEEFRTQAASKAHYLSNHFPGHREAAAEAFLDQIRTLAVEDWARADDDAVSVSDADQHEKVEFEGATADEEAETSASDSPSLAEGTEPEGDTPMDDSDPAWQGKNHDDSTFNREDAGQTVASRKTAAADWSSYNGTTINGYWVTVALGTGGNGDEWYYNIYPSFLESDDGQEIAGPVWSGGESATKQAAEAAANALPAGPSTAEQNNAEWTSLTGLARRKTAASTSNLSVGDRVMLTQDGKEREFEVTSIAPPGSTGRAESAGPRVTVTLVGGQGYNVSFDDHSQPGISSWSKVSARTVARRKTAADVNVIDLEVCSDCLMAAANGYDPHEWGRTADPEPWAEWDGYPGHPVAGDGEGHFSHHMCEGCGSRLAGDRYQAHWLEPKTASRKTAAEYQGGSPKEGDTATCHKDGGKIQFFAGEWMHLKGTGDSHNDVYPGKAKESSRKTASEFRGDGYYVFIADTDTAISGPHSSEVEAQGVIAQEAIVQSAYDVRYVDSGSAERYDILPRKASSRKTAVSLSNVGVESDTVGTGTDPSGKKVRFSITPAEAKQLKDILYSDLAINFSGVDVEESDIIREGAGPRRQAALTPVSELAPGDVIDPWGDGPSRVMNMKPGEFHPGMDVTLRLNDGREITHPFDSTEKVKKVATRTATEGRKAASRAGDDFSWAFDKEKASSRRKKVSNRRVAHNGWTNWDTWNAALWINNEEGIYRAALGTESPEALRALVEDFGLTGDGFDSDKVNWREVWTDSEFGPNHQGSRRTSRMAGGPAPFGRSPRRHHAVDQADKPCASCGRPVGWLEVFPNFGGEGILCIDCYSETPEGRRMPTSDELTRMWGGPVRQGSRKTAREAMVCETCGKEVEHADWDRCPHCGSSAGVEWETVASRRQAAAEGDRAIVAWAFSEAGVPDHLIDDLVDRFLAQWRGGQGIWPAAQAWVAGHVGSRRNHPSAGVDFSWAFANSKNSRKVQK